MGFAVFTTASVAIGAVGFTTDPEPMWCNSTRGGKHEHTFQNIQVGQ
jgi:hypothetical protein